jgi:hypothetical protein
VAAARAGLKFVIFTDHGNGTRAPDPPTYRSGVLCLDAVEISTNGGHYAVLGLEAAPYPLAGDAIAVVEDVTRLGGFGIATHPDSPKRSLRWSDWNLPIDAFEWLNADSEWRSEQRPALARAAAHYLLRGPEAIASLFERPVATLARWDEAGKSGRRLVALAGADAHARIGPRGAPDDDERGEADDAWSVRLPSYESVFRSLSLRVELERRFNGDARTDASRLVAALRSGRVFTVIDGYATPGAFEFFAERRSGLAHMGDIVAAEERPIRLRARTAAPAGATIVLYRNGAPVSSSSGVELTYDVSRDDPAPAMFRVELTLPQRGPRVRAPWIVSNAIYVDAPHAASSSSSERAGAWSDPVGMLQVVPMATGAWRSEHDSESRVALRGSAAGQGTPLEFRFSLGTGAKNVWAAIAHTLERPIGERGVLEITARASRPLRVSVQLRVDSTDADLRWRHSIYLDPTPRTVQIPVSEMRSVTRSVPADRLAAARGVLVVIDRTNTAPGTSGTIWLEDMRVRSGP